LSASAEGESTPNAVEVRVVHCSGPDRRDDIYLVPVPRDSRGELSQRKLKATTAKVPTDSFEALEAWTHERKPSKIQIFRKSHVRTFWLDDGKLRTFVDEYDEEDVNGLSPTAWRLLPLVLDNAEKIVSKNKAGNLIGISSSGCGKDDRRKQYYFNPTRDFLCEVHSESGGGERRVSMRILNYARTAAHWYPCKRRWVDDRGKEGKIVYIEINHVDDRRRIDKKVFDHRRISVSQLGPGQK